MASLIAHDVSFELPNGRLLFQHLSLTLEPRITALVGPNGIGKTCFARILAGLTEPSSGRVSVRGRISYFAQRETAPPETVAEFLASDWSPLLANINLDSRCCDLSGGQWMKVRLSLALKSDTDFFILDEPTNDLDRDGRAAVSDFLREFRGGVLLISHDRELLALCDDVVEFSNRGVSRYGLSWNDYVAEKEHERSELGSKLETAKREREAASEKRSTLVERQQKRSQKGARDGARGSLPKIFIGARKRQAQKTSGRVDSETMSRAAEAVSAAYQAYSAVKVDPIMYANLLAADVAMNALIFEADGFNARYDTHWIFKQDLNLAYRGPIRLAIRGENGSGKSTFLKLIMGETSLRTKGDFRSGTLPCLYVDQKCAALNDDDTVLESVRGLRSETELRNGLAKFLFTGDSVFQKVKDLSGGERLRLALAKGFLNPTPPGLVVLDEPTNNLDLANVEFLEHLLRGFKGALVVVSHDDVFLKSAGLDVTLDL